MRTPAKHTIRFSALVSLVGLCVLSGCVTKDDPIYIEPSDLEGKQCVQECVRDRLDCRIEHDQKIPAAPSAMNAYTEGMCSV